MRYEVGLRMAKDLFLYAAGATPHEVCGVAFGEHIPARTEVHFFTALMLPNIATEPRWTFEIDGQSFRNAHELAERSGFVLGVWHSHPTSRPTPSKEDFALISQLLDIPFIIVGVTVPVITIYERVELGRVREAYRESVKGL